MKLIKSSNSPDDLKSADVWRVCLCYECGYKVDSLVEIGDEPDYESETAYVCQSCLEKALNLIKQTTLNTEVSND